MGRINRASGTDRVAVQVGEVKPASKTSKPTPPTDTTPGRTENTRTGNARVGKQTDTVTGGLTIRF
ncbi:MAG TPA: hypothetical protein VFY17_02025 [Pilimelia sp.]|nr:hypothetical protein [Pilimelia sp.]